MKTLLSTLSLSAFAFSTIGYASSDMDTYEEQAALVINTVTEMAPQVLGQAVGSSLEGQLANTLVQMDNPLEGRETTLTLIEGLEVTVSNATLAPIGADVNVTMDQYQVVPTDTVGGVTYANGSIDGRIEYRLLEQTINIQMTSPNDEPVVYEGGVLDGTTVELDDLNITIRTQEYLPFWQSRIAEAEGSVFVNGTEIPVGDLIGLIAQ